MKLLMLGAVLCCCGLFCREACRKQRLSAERNLMARELDRLEAEGGCC